MARPEPAASVMDSTTLMLELLDPMLLCIVVPALAGLACLLIPRRAARTCGALAVASTALTLVLVWRLFSHGEDLELQAAAWLHLQWMP